MLRCAPDLGAPDLAAGTASVRRCAAVALVACACAAISWHYFDAVVAGWTRDLPPAFRRSPLFEGAKALGGTYGSILLLAVLAWARKRPRAFVTGGIALAICGLCVAALKLLIGRGRPDRSSLERPLPSAPVESYGDLSFPSGDAAQAFALAAIAAAFAPRSWRWAPYVLAVLPSIQRALAARHFCADVLSGIALGVVCAAIALRLERRVALRWAYPLCSRGLLGLLVAGGFASLWFMDEGRTFAMFYLPVVGLLLACANGRAVWRFARSRRLAMRGQG